MAVERADREVRAVQFRGRGRRDHWVLGPGGRSDPGVKDDIILDG